jgi:hypothetical protein
MTLASQQQLEDLCPQIVDALEVFIKTEGLEATEEPLIFALCEILHRKIKTCALKDEEKGSVIARLIAGFMELNATELAVYNEFRRILLEQKTSTVH